MKLGREHHARGALRSRWARVSLAASLVAALALSGALLVRHAQAAAYTVCPSGCTYASVNDAIAAAKSGDTITVGPGTYGPNETGVTTTDAQITVNKAVNLVGAGVGKSVINGIPTGQTTFTVAPLVAISTPSAPGNITISGFTLEGATYNGGGNDYGQLMSIHDTNASDVINVSGNLFYSDTTLNPTNQLDQIDSIYLYGSNAAVSVAGNTFKGVFRAALIEGNPGAFSFTGNDLNLHGLYDAATPSQLDYWAEGLLFLSDGGFDVTSAQVISGNTFESYDGMGVGLDAGYGGGLVGALSNVSITNNAFNDLGVAATQSSIADDAGIYLHGFGTSNGTTTSAIWGVTIQDNTFRMSSGSGHGYAVAMKGALGGPIKVDHNVMLGSGSSRPLVGVNLISPNSTTGLTITDNIVSGFATGLNSDALPVGASVSATRNCVTGNSAAGATVAAGVALAADHNWWGAASGPHNATSNPSGTGDGASGSISFTPFLTSPAAVCAGPVASNVLANPNPAAAHSTFTLTATLSDATTGNFSIASAQFNIDGGQFYPLYPQDGSFNQVAEVATGRVAIQGAGKFTVCVRGTDAFGDTGALACTLVTLTAPVTATATAEATAEATTTATTAPSDTPAPTATSGPATQPPSVGFATGGFPIIPVLIGILALLIIIGVILFFALGRRRRDDGRYPR